MIRSVELLCFVAVAVLALSTPTFAATGKETSVDLETTVKMGDAPAAADENNVQSASCDHCIDFVRGLRSMLTTVVPNSPPYDWKTNDTCPALSTEGGLCEDWKTSENRANLVWQVQSDMCAKEICIRRKFCSRSQCESCQVLVAPAAYLYQSGSKAQVGPWLESRLSHFCEAKAFADAHKEGLCNEQKRRDGISSISTWPADLEQAPAVGLKLCQSFGECAENVEEAWVSCNRTAPPAPGVIAPENGCEYDYKFAMGTKIKMGGLFEREEDKKKKKNENGDDDSNAAENETGHKVRGRSVVVISSEFTLHKLGNDSAGNHVFQLNVTAARIDQGEQQVIFTFDLQQNPFFFKQAPTGEVVGIIYSPRESMKILNIKRRIADLFHFRTAAQNGATFAIEEDNDYYGPMQSQYSVKYTKKAVAASSATNDLEELLEFEPEEAKLDPVSDTTATDGDGDVQVSSVSKRHDRTLSQMHIFAKTVVDVDRAIGVVRSSAVAAKQSSGHLKQSDDRNSDGSPAGLNSFTVRAKESARVTLIDSRCPVAQAPLPPPAEEFSNNNGGEAEVVTADIQVEENATPLRLLNHADDVAASLGLARGSLVGGTVEAQPEDFQVDNVNYNPTPLRGDAAYFTAPVTSKDADKHPQAKDVEAAVKMVPKLVQRANEELLKMPSPRDAKSDAIDALEEMARNDMTGRVVHAIGKQLFLLQNGPTPFCRMQLIKAITGMAGSNGAAQQVIHDLLTSSSTSAAEHTALLHSMLTMERPSRDLVEYLLQTASSEDDHEHTITAASAPVLSILGAVAGRLPVHHEMHKFIHNFIHRIREGCGEEDVDGHEVALIALGNIGSSDDLALFKSYLHHPSAVLRAQAVTCLRRLPAGAAPTDLITTQFIEDSSSPVRHAALAALNARGLTRSGWEKVAHRISSAAKKAAPLSADVAKHLTSLLAPHGITFLLQTKEEPAAAATTTAPAATSPLFQGVARGALTTENMWNETACSVPGQKFTFLDSKDVDLGAKEFKLAVYSQFVAKGSFSAESGLDLNQKDVSSAAGANFCSTFATETGAAMEVVGRMVQIFSFRIDASLTPEQKLARPTLTIFGFQMAISKGAVQFNQRRSIEDVPSVLCKTVQPWILYPMVNASDVPVANGTIAEGGSNDVLTGTGTEGTSDSNPPLQNAPTQGSPAFSYLGGTRFSVNNEIRILGVIKFVVTTALDFHAGVIAEPCAQLSNDHFVFGTAPYAKIKVLTQSGMNGGGAAGAGVGMDIDVMEGDVVETAVVNMKAGGNAGKCPSSLERGLAGHLNWKAISGKFYVYTTVGGKKELTSAVCFPRRRNPNVEVPSSPKKAPPKKKPQVPIAEHQAWPNGGVDESRLPTDEEQQAEQAKYNGDEQQQKDQQQQDQGGAETAAEPTSFLAIGGDFNTQMRHEQDKAWDQANIIPDGNGISGGDKETVAKQLASGDEVNQFMKTVLKKCSASSSSSVPAFYVQGIQPLFVKCECLSPPAGNGQPGLLQGMQCPTIPSIQQQLVGEKKAETLTPSSTIISPGQLKAQMEAAMSAETDEEYEKIMSSLPPEKRIELAVQDLNQREPLFDQAFETVKKDAAQSRVLAAKIKAYRKRFEGVVKGLGKEEGKMDEFSQRFKALETRVSTAIGRVRLYSDRFKSISDDFDSAKEGTRVDVDKFNELAKSIGIPTLPPLPKDEGFVVPMFPNPPAPTVQPVTKPPVVQQANNETDPDLRFQDDSTHTSGIPSAFRMQSGDNLDSNKNSNEPTTAPAAAAVDDSAATAAPAADLDEDENLADVAMSEDDEVAAQMGGSLLGRNGNIDDWEDLNEDAVDGDLELASWQLDDN